MSGRDLASLAALVRVSVPGMDRVRGFYDYFGPAFEAVCEGSGILNVGYALDPTTADLAQAQAELVRQGVAALPREGTWIDVGCGLGGPATVVLAEAPSVRVIGVNRSVPQVLAARERARQLGLADRLTFLEGDAQAIPVPPGSASGVYAIETALHYPDKAAFLASAFAALRPGGVLAMTDLVWRPGPHALRTEATFRLGVWMYAARLWSTSRWEEEARRVGFVDTATRDVSEPTLGLLPRWAERYRAHHQGLRARYPAPVLHLAVATLERLYEARASGPVGYAVVTARKPGAG